MRIGVIGGTGLYDLGDTVETIRVDTAWGQRRVEVSDGPTGDPLFFLNRHGGDHSVPPHRIEHRANIQALATCRVEAVLAVHNVGGLRDGLTTGHVVIPDDLVDMAQHDGSTFFDDDVVHIDLSEPYCPHVRQAWLNGAQAHADAERVHDGGTYVAVRGPRLETPAEGRFLRSLGDIVGMTGCPEAALARERGLCYASLSFVANAAAGRSGRVAAAEIRQALQDDGARVGAIIRDAVSAVPASRDCGCPTAPTAGRMDATPTRH